MAANDSRTRVPSTKRSSHENQFIGWENIAVVFQDKDGTIKATGAGLFKDTRSWFTQDFRERFQDVLLSGQPTQLSSVRPVKRCRASVDNPGKRKAVEVLSDYSNTQQATVQYWQILTSCPQNDWRVIGEAWIELIEPDKRHLYPYSGGDKAKPKWWPRRLRHETPHHLLTNERIILLIHILRMSGKGKITCAKLLEAAEQKAEAGKITERALTVLDEIIAIRKNEEEVETQRNHDGITATGAPDEVLNWELLQVSWLASKHGRGRYPVRSPEDPIEEISPTSPSVEPSSGFTPSSHPSTSEAPAKPMYYRGSPEEQIETTSPASPSERSSPRLTPSLYPSTSEASANLLYYHGQYHTPYTVAQSINLGASIMKAPSTGLYTNKQHQVPSPEHTIRWLQSTQPIQSAYHSCRCCHCSLMAQHSGFGPVNSTALSP
ncbi:hypothetical protein KXV78_008739, partial [Aspergillus fumigatus]